MVPVKWQQNLILILLILQNYLKMTLDLSTPLNNDTPILTFKEVNDSKINMVISPMTMIQGQRVYNRWTQYLLKSIRRHSSLLFKNINWFTNEGVLPSCWKAAIITPVFKSVDHMGISKILR